MELYCLTLGWLVLITQTNLPNFSQARPIESFLHFKLRHVLVSQELEIIKKITCKQITKNFKQKMISASF
jgi:hypothetical protein